MNQTTNQSRVGEEFRVQSSRFIEKLRELVVAGNARSIVIKHHGDVVAKLPLTVGVIGTAIAPWLAAIGVIAIFLTESSLSVERNPDVSRETGSNQPTSRQGPTGM